MKKKYLLMLLLLTLNLLAIKPQKVKAQCAEGEQKITIVMSPSQQESAASWELTYPNGELIGSGTYWENEVVCIPENACTILTMRDSWGYAFEEPSQFYSIFIDDTFYSTTSGDEFYTIHQTPVNCVDGSVCHSAEPAVYGTNTSALNDSWFSFTTNQNGHYLIDLCDVNCSTTLMVYDYCEELAWDNTPINSISVAEDNCDDTDGEQLLLQLPGEETYFIRILDIDNDCATEEISWELSDEGAIAGCMDRFACNYDPLALVSDPEQCLYVPDEACMPFVNAEMLDSTLIIDRVVAIELNTPTELKYGPDDHLWLIESEARILRVNPITKTKSVVLDLTKMLVPDGNGIYALEFHPEFESNPYVYVVYTHELGEAGTFTRLAQYTWDGLILGAETPLFEDIATGIGVGEIGITPDHKLLMSVGHGSYNFLGVDIPSQSLSIPHGKILRINLDGSIPEDNPLPDSYIYSIGHTVTSDFCFSPDSTIYNLEHTELNIISPLNNYGYPGVSGYCDENDEFWYCNYYENNTEPLTVISGSPSPRASGFVYYDHPAIPEFQNTYLWAMMGVCGQLDGHVSNMHIIGDSLAILNEEMYFASTDRIRDITMNPHTGAIYYITNDPKLPSTGYNQIIEYRNYDWQDPADTLNTSIAPSITNNPLQQQQFVEIYPNPVSSQSQIVLSESFIGQTMDLYSYTGQLVKQLPVTSSNLYFDKQNLATGTYFLKVSNKLGTITKKIIIL